MNISLCAPHPMCAATCLRPRLSLTQAWSCPSRFLLQRSCTRCRPVEERGSRLMLLDLVATASSQQSVWTALGLTIARVAERLSWPMHQFCCINLCWVLCSWIGVPDPPHTPGKEKGVRSTWRKNQIYSSFVLIRVSNHD